MQMDRAESQNSQKIEIDCERSKTRSHLNNPQINGEYNGDII